MESTFVLKPEEFNADFVKQIKKLFSNSMQLQITINSSEDFGLLLKETPDQYLSRLTAAANDLDKGENQVSYTESQLDEIVLERLR